MKYKNILKLYGSTWVENELGEEEQEFGYIKDVFCNIKPSFGGQESIGGTDVKGVYSIQRIFIRKLSIIQPAIDMYFLDETGAKYAVLDFFPNYKDNSEWEFRTRITREV